MINLSNSRMITQRGLDLFYFVLPTDESGNPVETLPPHDGEPAQHCKARPKRLLQPFERKIGGAKGARWLAAFAWFAWFGFFMERCRRRPRKGASSGSARKSA